MGRRSFCLSSHAYRLCGLTARAILQVHPTAIYTVGTRSRREKLGKSNLKSWFNTKKRTAHLESAHL